MREPRDLPRDELGTCNRRGRKIQSGHGRHKNFKRQREGLFFLPGKRNFNAEEESLFHSALRGERMTAGRSGIAEEDHEKDGGSPALLRACRTPRAGEWLLGTCDCHLTVGDSPLVTALRGCGNKMRTRHSGATCSPHG